MRLDLTARARLAGALYALTTAAALFASLAVRGTLVVPGNAVETARHLLASEALYRLGFGADVFADVAYIAVTYLLYEIFRPVDRSWSAAAAAFSFVGCAVGAVAAVAHLGAMTALTSSALDGAFSSVQRDALAMLVLDVHGQAYEASLVFFGVYCTIVGALIWRSPMIPKAIGVLMVVAGIAYFVDTSATLVFPHVSNPLLDAVGMVPLAGEGALTVWLLIFGARLPSPR